MPISTINNGDTGVSCRTTINATITAVNRLNEGIEHLLADAALDPYVDELYGAYSTSTRLVRGYEGKTSLRVRETLTNNEADIAVRRAGIDAASLSTLVGAASGCVKSLRNQFPRGGWPEFYQATNGSQLRIANNGVIDNINGHTAIFSTTGSTKTLVPVSTAATGNSWAVIMVVESTAPYATQSIAAGSTNNWLIFHSTNSKIYFSAPAPLGTNLNSYDNGHANADWDKYQYRPMVFGLRVKDGLQEMYINGWRTAQLAITGNFPLSITNLGYSGTSTLSWGGSLTDLIVFNSADAAGFFPTLSTLTSAYSAKPVIVLAGDSLTTGSGASGSPLQSYGRQLVNLTDYVVFLVATIGHRVDQVANALSAVNPSFSPRLSGDVIKNGCVCWAGINDLSQNVSVATLQTKLQSLWAQQRAAGMVVLACTLIGSIDAGGVTQQKLLDINTWIRSQTSSYDALIDFGADVRIGVGHHSDTTYFYSDSVHLNNNGYSVVSSLVKSALDVLYP